LEKAIARKNFKQCLKNNDFEHFFASRFVNKIGISFEIQKRKHGGSYPRQNLI
jgi:hypothetical protein